MLYNHIHEVSDMTQNTLTIDSMKKYFLYTFICFLTVTATLAIISVLYGEFGDFQGKVLATSSIITAASICSLCCSAHIGRKKHPLPGMAGIGLAIVTAFFVIAAVWLEIDRAVYLKTTGILAIFTVAFAHSLVLCAVRLQEDQRWIQWGAAANIFVLAIILSLFIVFDFIAPVVFELVAVLSILIALETLVIPLLFIINKVVSYREKESLSLTKREDGMYEDTHGCVFEVKEISQDAIEISTESES